MTVWSLRVECFLVDSVQRLCWDGLELDPWPTVLNAEARHASLFAVEVQHFNRM